MEFVYHFLIIVDYAFYLIERKLLNREKTSTQRLEIKRLSVNFGDDIFTLSVTEHRQSFLLYVHN